MKHSTVKIAVGVIALAAWECNLTLEAQNPFRIRLYEKARDDAAQKAAEAAAKLASGSLFDKELKNLDILGSLEIDSVFQGEHRSMRDRIDEIAVSTWGAVDTRVAGLNPDATIQAVEAEIAQLERSRDAKKERLKSLQAQTSAAKVAVPSNPADAVTNILANGGDIDVAAKAVLGNLKGANASEAAKINETVGKAISEAATAAKTVAANQAKVIDVIKQLQELQTGLEDLAAQRLALEIDDLQKRIDIRKREREELITLRGLAKGYGRRAADLRNHDRTVIETIQCASGQKPNCLENVEELTTALDLAYLAAAIYGRWDSSSLTATLRDSIEQHRHAIRLSQLEAHAYEIAIGSGAQRLAIFYRGGVHPETVAQIIYTAATAAIPWAIKTK